MQFFFAVLDYLALMFFMNSTLIKEMDAFWI